MSSFTNPLVVMIEQGEVDGRGLAQLVQPFSYDVGYEGSGDTVTVPFGFVTDFSSVPPFGRLLISNFDRAAKAAVVHDFLVRSGQRPRPEADRIFYEAMGVLGVPTWRRVIMYAAVRLYAWFQKLSKRS